MPRPLPDPIPPSRATFAPFGSWGTAFEQPAQRKGCPLTGRRGIAVSPSVCCPRWRTARASISSTALRVMDGLGLTMLVVPKAHTPWLEQAAAHATKTGEDAVREVHAWLEE
ncbi:hypothetical protein CNE_BB2p01200 (plasmid) [Cupriavidus necator N-1]|uniref:Uncharacterized protein n=1 Tax=Cupriavidus necator (strain ATCC 43291 / DSM 13513 / CCUG 52238 / LMG 8453 / N-1) TaxID=1042878 RepID=F8GYJ0_CUPNN|nr:hypothetical protein CNE_BB2p01200 [Cupriavidus necator N-1]